ncbi:ABC transporter permease [Saccharolobus islandicus]|uniref:ABC transporter permease n=1 Tax=Saccharolobus islandicus TaxID=43080 RepID=UPI00036EA111|nr:ABC transporter permease [Sulfolobus islandicus]
MNIGSIKKYILGNKLIATGFFIILADTILGIIGQFWTPYQPFSTFTPSLPPSFQHLLGTDVYGYDVFSQMLRFTLPTLLVGYAIGVITTIIAAIVSLLAGYYASKVVGTILDILLIVVLSIPGIVLLIVIGAYFESANLKVGYFTIILTLTLTGWAWGARNIRPQVMSLSNKDYIIASKLIGEKSWRIMFTQIMPPIIPLLVSQFLFGTLYGILSLATAEFFGAIPVTTENLGTMLSLIVSSAAYLSGNWWWILGAILPIIILAIGIGFMMVGFDEIADPRLRKIKFSIDKIEIPIQTDEKVITIIVRNQEVVGESND